MAVVRQETRRYPLNMYGADTDADAEAHTRARTGTQLSLFVWGSNGKQHLHTHMCPGIRRRTTTTQTTKRAQTHTKNARRGDTFANEILFSFAATLQRSSPS